MPSAFRAFFPRAILSFPPVTFVSRILRSVLRNRQIVLAEGGPDDKRGGRRDGPPDLDELWRDLNRRLGGLFGQRKGPGGPQRPIQNGGTPPSSPGSGRGASIALGAVAVAAVLIWLASGIFIVQEGQVGVILQFGKYKNMTGPGINWRLPYPFQSHEVVNVSGVRTIEVGYSGSVRTKVPRESLMLTDDENIIDIQLAVQYRLKDATEFLFNNRRPEDNVKQAAEAAVREVVGRSKMDYVLYEGREQVAIQVAALTQQILERYKTGILVTSVTMQNAQPPEQVQASFDDAVKAGQDRERSKNEGQAYANDVIPRARGAASRLLQEADGYKQKVVAQAQGDASRFGQVVAEYAKAPVVTRQRMYLDTMQDIFANTSKIMIDAKSGGNLLYLPLDKLLQQAATQDAARTAAANASAAASAALGQAPVSAPPATGAEIDPRSREGLRNRDRGVQ